MAGHAIQRPSRQPAEAFASSTDLLEATIIAGRPSPRLSFSCLEASIGVTAAAAAARFGLFSDKG